MYLVLEVIFFAIYDMGIMHSGLVTETMLGPRSLPIFNIPNYEITSTSVEFHGFGDLYVLWSGWLSELGVLPYAYSQYNKDLWSSQHNNDLWSSQYNNNNNNLRLSSLRPSHPGLLFAPVTNLKCRKSHPHMYARCTFDRRDKHLTCFWRVKRAILLLSPLKLYHPIEVLQPINSNIKCNIKWLL